ncbi:hypothetical protein D3C73_1119090 [compost metagenome]
MADTDALTLETVVFDPAVGHAQGQFVFIADTVGAGETVVTEQRRIVECVFAGIEYRDVFLIYLRYVQVEQARLEGLAVVLAEPLGISIEVQTTVDAGDRYAAILVAVKITIEIFSPGCRCGLILLRDLSFAETVQIQLVLRVLVLKRWLQESVGPVQWQADSRCQVEAIAIGACQADNVGI